MSTTISYPHCSHRFTQEAITRSVIASSFVHQNSVTYSAVAGVPLGAAVDVAVGA